MLITHGDYITRPEISAMIGHNLCPLPLHQLVRAGRIGTAYRVTDLQANCSPVSFDQKTVEHSSGRCDHAHITRPTPHRELIGGAMHCPQGVEQRSQWAKVINVGNGNGGCSHRLRLAPLPDGVQQDMAFGILVMFSQIFMPLHRH